jgi:hypothetical protein
MAIVALSVVLLAACSSAMQQGAPARSSNSSVITAEELRASNAGNLYDYVRAQRPRWLERNYSAVMRPQRVQEIVVFLDNQEFGGPTSLQQFPVTSAAELRYYGPSEAQARFGPGYINGVIQVITRAGR